VWYLNPPEGQTDALDARLLLIGQEARAQGLPLVVHATELRNAKVALRAGAAVLVHSVEDAPVDDEFIRLAREAQTVYAPTLLVGRNWKRAIASVAFGVNPAIDDKNGCVDAETRRVIGEAAALQPTQPSGAARDGVRHAGAEVRGAIGTPTSAGSEAGIPIATATDAATRSRSTGPRSTEMEAMERAGIPAARVLVMSTRDGAAMMSRLGDFGTVEAGKLADLVVLTNDPGASTSAFRSITHVMRGGVLHEIAHFTGH
jgi:imidazolonepropionase-like amidohydrolase